MVRRIVGITLVVLGIAAVVLGILSATTWRTSEVVSATHESAEVPFVVVEPGVAGIVNDQVDITVTAAAEDQAIAVIEGRDVDVEGWIGDLPYLAITGLADWEDLTTQVVEATEGEAEDGAEGTEGEGSEGEGSEGEGSEGEGEGAEDGEASDAEIPSPLGSDMWTQIREGEGELEFSWFQPEDRTVLFIVRDGQEGPAPTVTLTWQREVSTPYVMPLTAGGTAAVVVGLALLVWSFLPARRRAEEGAEDHDDATGSDGSSSGEEKTAEDGAVNAGGAATSAAAAADGDSSTTDARTTEASTTDASTTDSTEATTSDTSATPTNADAGAVPAAAPRLTRRQIREMRRVHGEDASTAELEAIAAEIPLGDSAAPGTAAKPVTDAATDYPAWLRGDADGSTAEGEEEPGEPRPRVSIADASAWRRRWGVSSPSEAASQVPGPETDGSDQAADSPDKSEGEEQ